MNRLTTFQTEFNVRDSRNRQGFQFLGSQYPEKYGAYCNSSCEYYKDGKCTSASSICTYKRKESYANPYRV